MLWVALWLGGALLVSNYATSKGLKSFPYFIASIFFTPVVGFLAAAAAQPGRQIDQRPASQVKKCPDCAETILLEAKKCRFCGYVFGAT